MSQNRLIRSNDRIIGGVCGGIAEWLGWDPTLMRVLYLLASILSIGFPGILVYIVLWIVMPEKRSYWKIPGWTVSPEPVRALKFQWIQKI